MWHLLRVLQVVLGFVIGLAGLSCQPEGDNMVTEEHAQYIASKYLEARNTPNLALLDDIYSEDVIVHDSSAPADIHGLEELKSFYGASHEGFPDMEFRFDDVLPSGDHVIFRGTVEGTHTGSLRGMPPTGRHVRFSCVAIDRLENGKIVEEWVYFNVLDLLGQLGVAPPPSATGP